MIPEHVDSRDQQTFVGGMYTAHGRAERNHIQIRIGLQEQSALQPRMDRSHFRFLAEQTLITVDGDLENL